MARWNIVVSEDTDCTVRSYLARTGGKRGDLSRFNRPCGTPSESFGRHVESIWERNKNLSAEEGSIDTPEALCRGSR